MRQIISFNTNPDPVVAGEQFAVNVFHEIQDADTLVNDLIVRLHFDSTQLEVVDTAVAEGIPGFLGGATAETNNDGNEQTNQEIEFLFNSVTLQSLPEENTQIFNVTFNTVGEDFDSTPIVIEGTGEMDFEFDGVNTTLEIDRLPEVANPIADIAVDEDAANETIDLSNVFSDPDGDAITLAIQNNNNSELVTTTLDGNNLILDFLDDQFGTAEITVSASDNQETVQDTFTVTVNPVDDAPTVVNPIADVTVDENAANQTIDLSGVFEDIDSADIELQIVENNQPNDVVEPLLNQEDLTLTLDFRENQSGTENITVRATADGLSVEDTFTVTVNSTTPTTIELYRFRNTTTETGTYLYVDATERDAILANPDFNQTFELEGGGNPAFTASLEAEDDLIPFYRLRSLDLPGSYLFASTEEYDAIFAEDSEQRDKWVQEGLDDEGQDIADFYLLPPSSGSGELFNRYKNTQNGGFLFVGPEESAAIESNDNLSNAFTLEGEAFESII